MKKKSLNLVKTPRRRKKINGIFILSKPSGMSSNQALQRVKRAFDAEKAGHTGSLDPMATGVLPICLGEATKFSQYLLDADKSYRSTFSLGIKTDTGDSDGEIVSIEDTNGVDFGKVQDAAEKFLGQIRQVPPMYSAIKRQGTPLYKLARQGIKVDREPRIVRIHKYQIERFIKKPTPKLDVDIRCSKGTYIRALAEELGSILGCGAHVSRLDRYAVGPFDERDATSLGYLEKIEKTGNRELLESLLCPVDAGINDYPKVNLDAAQMSDLTNGQSVLLSQCFITGQEADIVRVFDENQKFMGVAQITGDNSIKPKRLIAK